MRTGGCVKLSGFGLLENDVRLRRADCFVLETRLIARKVERSRCVGAKFEVQSSWRTFAHRGLA